MTHDPALVETTAAGPPTSPTRRFPTYPVTRQRTAPGWGALVATGVIAAVAGGIVGAAADGSSPSSIISFADAPAPGPGATTRPEGSVAQIAATALPSVVTLDVRSPAGEGTGSGWVLDTAGHIVTNNHVVADAMDNGRITVVAADGREATATVVGHDESYDLAVLAVSDLALNPLPLGRSADLVVGDHVIAMGAPLGLEGTVTTGIISALNRPVSAGDSTGAASYINAIQTDAAINPGNSGGPLLDMSGRVIGVTSAIARMPGEGASTGQSGSIGLGFAIPSDQVAKTVDQLIRTGRADHPVIGVLIDRRYSGEGVRIALSGSDGNPALTPGGPAEKAGIKPGDIIITFDGRPITAPDELVVAIRAKSVGDTVTLGVRRGEQEFDVKMVLQGSRG
ncbi:MAG: S1C family serine protease [Nostocoides sp.]